MDVYHESLQQGLPDVLKVAVNAFYCSVFHHGPYFINPECALVRPVEGDCIWHELWNNDGKCIYICDTAAFQRLHKALTKVVIYDRGLAWPHVNLSSETPAIQWLMFRDDNTELSMHSSVPTPKTWFVISQEFQDIVDHVASLHYLVPSRSTVTVKHCIGVAMTERFLNATQSDTSLTSIIMRPGDIITSFIPSYAGASAKYPLLPHSSSIQTMCIAEKHNVKNFISSPMSEVAPLTNTDLKYHITFRQLPLFLKSMIASVLQVKHVCNEQITALHDEINIKEEPLIAEVNFSEEGSVNDSKNPKWTTHMLQERAYQKPEGKLFRLGGEKNFGTLLQCPKCPTTFKFGHSGAGLNLLMSHVHNRHKRFKDHCTSVIQRRYASILEGANVCDSYIRK